MFLYNNLYALFLNLHSSHLITKQYFVFVVMYQLTNFLLNAFNHNSHIVKKSQIGRSKHMIVPTNTIYFIINSYTIFALIRSKQAVCRLRHSEFK